MFSSKNLFNSGVAASCLALGLSSCSLTPRPAGTDYLKPEQSETTNNSNVQGPFALDVNEAEAIYAYTDRAASNVFSVECRLVDSLQINLGDDKIVLNKEQLVSLGFGNCLQSDDLALKITGGKLDLVRLPANNSEHLTSVGTNAFVSVIGFGAQVDDQTSKNGVLIVSGKQAIFVYESNTGKLTIDPDICDKYPGQFAEVLAFHRDTILNISKSNAAKELRASLPDKFSKKSNES